jgi:hypothetical protein
VHPRNNLGPQPSDARLADFVGAGELTGAHRHPNRWVAEAHDGADLLAGKKTFPFVIVSVDGCRRVHNRPLLGLGSAPWWGENNARHDTLHNGAVWRAACTSG